MKRDAAGQPLGNIRCTASGQQRTWERDCWGEEFVICPDCGHVGDICWIRGTDLPPHAKTRAHKAPQGITPKPYGILPTGGKRFTDVTQCVR